MTREQAEGTGVRWIRTALAARTAPSITVLEVARNCGRGWLDLAGCPPVAFGWRIALSIFLTLAVAACGSSGGGSGGTSTPSPRSYQGTSDTGDRIRMSVTDTSFSATETGNAMTLSASRQTLPSLFLEMTVEAATNGPSVGDRLVGLELPGVMMIVKDADISSTNHDSPVIGVAEGGVCPADGTYIYNVVQIPGSSWNISTSDAYNVVTLVVSGANITPTVTHFLANGNPGTGGGPSALTCAQGTIQDGSGLYITITPGGVIVGSDGSGGGGFVGMLAPSSPVNLVAMAAAGEYRGIAGGGSSSSRPLGARHVTGSPEAGDLNGFTYSNVLDNTVDYTKVTKLLFGTQTSNGLVTGLTATDYTGGTTLLDGVAGSSNTLIFIVGQSGGKYLLIGLDPTNVGNFILIQQ